MISLYGNIAQFGTQTQNQSRASDYRFLGYPEISPAKTLHSGSTPEWLIDYVYPRKKNPEMASFLPMLQVVLLQRQWIHGKH